MAYIGSAGAASRSGTKSGTRLPIAWNAAVAPQLMVGIGWI